jgi:hypothetical protein
MCGLLIGFNGCKLLGGMLCCSSSRQSSQLTVVCQRSNLVCNQLRNQLFAVVVVVVRQRPKCILVQERWSISMVACCGCSCIQFALKSFLDHHLERNPCLRRGL